jgi:polyhydroxybutyrate depolymerase
MGRNITIILFACFILMIGFGCGRTAPVGTPSTSITINTPLSGNRTTIIPSAINPTLVGQTLVPPPPGDTTHKISFDGEQRTYILHIPPNLDPKQPSALVFVFHGFGLDGEEMVRITGFNTQADTSGFIVVYPNGTGRKSSWNGGDCCGEAAVKEVDDVGFVRALIKEISQLVSIDNKRIYATGFSNGAIMDYRLACDLSDQIAAIAPVSATQAVQSCQPTRPVSIIHFHGTADKLNPYEGGQAPGGAIDFLSVKEGIQFWVGLNQCENEAKLEEFGKIVHETYSHCSQESAVELYTILDGEHAWPGGESVSHDIGEPTTEILATPLIWEFFLSHPIP